MSEVWQRRLLGTPGSIAAVAWGFAEGCFFFVVPDVLLCLTAMFSLRRAVLQTLATVAGALVAGSLLFAWASRDAPAARAAVLAVPFVEPAMAATVDADLDRHGAGGLLLGPFSGIPYKLYAVSAPGRVALGPFLFATVPARLERLAGGVLLFAGVGWLLRRRGLAVGTWGIRFHAGYWLVIYALYWGLA